MVVANDPLRGAVQASQERVPVGLGGLGKRLNTPKLRASELEADRTEDLERDLRTTGRRVTHRERQIVEQQRACRRPSDRPVRLKDDGREQLDPVHHELAVSRQAQLPGLGIRPQPSCPLTRDERCLTIGRPGTDRHQRARDPTRDESYAATYDGPATLNGRLVHASEKEKLSDYVISMSLNGRTATTRARNVRKAIRISRNMGSAALALAYVANGRFDAMVQQGGLSQWDVAAAGLIAERGGATVTSSTGEAWFDLARPAKSIGVLAAPPAHHEGLLRLVR